MLQALGTNTNKGESPKMALQILCLDNQEQAKTQLKIITNRTGGDSQKEAIGTVEAIIQEVANNGDSAIIEYTKKFDRFNPSQLIVEPEKLEKAWAKTPLTLQESLKTAYKRIKEFHQLQIPKNISIEGIYGEHLGRKWRPVQKAGIYVPGGRAAYPSTVLMNAIPALVASVEELIMVTPAGASGEINTTVLAAAHLVGIKKVFKIGGAQAIAALAYGTESIPKVDVITGPGNLYVTLAKKFVYGKVGIDSLAGPSEVLIIADHTAKVSQVATDLLAQAEHDPLAAAILITTDINLAKAIPAEINKQLINHPREHICRESLSNWGLIIICKDLSSCTQLSDFFAPEHLELLVENPNDLANKIKNAGAIFLGPWTPEAVGDYLAGPNHTLPTSGTARFSGALSVETFMKNTSVIQFTKNALENTKDAVISLANSEGLYSHAESIKIRCSKSSSPID
tara:strand:+ start:1298 stop:2662 length:1365 start_codon:yes stop_codon:yes gene_type:complete